MSPAGAILPLVILVASGERPALEALRPRMEAAAGEPVRLRSGDAGALSKEIEGGSAADGLLADDATVDRLALDDRIDRPGVLRGATSGLAIVLAKDGSFRLPGRFDGATAPAFARLPFRRLAMLPATSAAGRAAREALDSTRIFDDVEERFVVVANSDEARALLGSGAAEVAIVPLAVAVAWELPFTRIESSLYAPLGVSAGIVSTSKSKDAAGRALGAALAPAAQDVWKSFGYKAR